MDNPEIFGVIEKNSRSFLVIRRGDVNGFDCVEFRIWTRGENGKPEFPTKKGITVRSAVFPQVSNAVEAVMDSLAEKPA